MPPPAIRPPPPSSGTGGAASLERERPILPIFRWIPTAMASAREPRAGEDGVADAVPAVHGHDAGRFPSDEERWPAKIRFPRAPPTRVHGPRVVEEIGVVKYGFALLGDPVDPLALASDICADPWAPRSPPRCCLSSIEDVSPRV